MKKKNGFIATSLIYSFFLVFITLFLTIIADYLQNKVLLNTIESDIKENINGTKNIGDFKVGDVLFFQFTNVADYSNLKCGTDINLVSECSEANLTSIQYKIESFEVKSGEKIDTLKLLNTDANSTIYVYCSSLKFLVQKNIGTGITITGVS